MCLEGVPRGSALSLSPHLSIIGANGVELTRVWVSIVFPLVCGVMHRHLPLIAFGPALSLPSI